MNPYVRWASNPKVPGSNPGRDVLFFLNNPLKTEFVADSLSIVSSLSSSVIASSLIQELPSTHEYEIRLSGK